MLLGGVNHSAWVPRAAGPDGGWLMTFPRPAA